MMINGSYNIPVDLVGSATTGSSAEQTLPLSANGGAPAAAVACPAGYWTVLAAFHVTAEAAARFVLQKTTDGGSTWADLHHWRQPQDGASGVDSDNGLIFIQGGAGVQLRMRVTTPGGAAYVSVSLHGYEQP